MLCWWVLLVLVIFLLPLRAWCPLWFAPLCPLVVRLRLVVVLGRILLFCPLLFRRVLRSLSLLSALPLVLAFGLVLRPCLCFGVPLPSLGWLVVLWLFPCAPVLLGVRMPCSLLSVLLVVRWSSSCLRVRLPVLVLGAWSGRLCCRVSLWSCFLLVGVLCPPPLICFLCVGLRPLCFRVASFRPCDFFCFVCSFFVKVFLGFCRYI